MIVNDMKNKIKEILNSITTIQIHFILKNKDRVFSIKKADLENGDTSNDLMNLFKETLTSSYVENGDLSICKLSTADERQNVVYEYDYDSFPEELNLLKNFDINNAIQNEKFSFSKDNLSDLYGYLIYIGTMTYGITMLKKHYPISLIKRDTFILGAIKSDNRFKRVTDQDFLRINGTIQLILLDDIIFVKNLKVLERNLGFTQLIFKRAADTIDEIEKMNLLEDINVMKDAAEGLPFARKLSKIGKNSPIVKRNIPNDVILKFTRENPGLIGKFKYSDDNKIVLDTKVARDTFIKLLSDSYLISELTKQNYESVAKDEITV